jgi:hypothetical protein
MVYHRHEITKILLNVALHTHYVSSCKQILLMPFGFRAPKDFWDCHGRDRMVVCSTTTCAISTVGSSNPAHCVLDATLCDQVCQ